MTKKISLFKKAIPWDSKGESKSESKKDKRQKMKDGGYRVRDEERDRERDWERGTKCKSAKCVSSKTMAAVRRWKPCIDWLEKTVKQGPAKLCGYCKHEECLPVVLFSMILFQCVEPVATLPYFREEKYLNRALP